jgi:hypothetical protein
MARGDNTLLLKIADSMTSLSHRLDRFDQRERERGERLRREQSARADWEDRKRRQAEFAGFQARIDTLLQPYHGLRAPAPGAGQSERSYKIELWGLLQQQLPPHLDREIDVGHGRRVNIAELARLQLGRCDDATLAVFGRQIEGAARALAFANDSVPEGDVEERRHVGVNGHDRREFIGTRSFVRDLAAENRYAKFNDPVALAMVAAGKIKL